MHLYIHDVYMQRSQSDFIPFWTLHLYHDDRISVYAQCRDRFGITRLSMPPIPSLVSVLERYSMLSTAWYAPVWNTLACAYVCMFTILEIRILDKFHLYQILTSTNFFKKNLHNKKYSKPPNVSFIFSVNFQIIVDFFF